MTLTKLAMCAHRINAKHDDFTLLDVGCRTMDLQPFLNGCSTYHGTDLIPMEGVLQCDLDRHLPFDDDQFDVVTVLDVLEHLNNPHTALQELYRVARKTVLISLPNMYYITFRMNFLRGHGISVKYSFPKQPILDRHRWLLSFTEALEFIRGNLEGHHLEYDVILPGRNRTRMVSEPIEKWLSSKWPNMFVYGVLFQITLNK